MNHLRTVARSVKRLLLKPRSLLLARAEAARLERSAGRPRIFYLMGLNEGHKNLGDQAQGVAIRLWFARHFPQHLVFEYRCHERFDFVPLLQRAAAEGDLFVLHSGGNFGDTWPVTEQIRQDLIAAFPGHPMVQLPQTIDFSATPAGQALLAGSQRVINAHPRMIIMGRDQTSYELARGWFPGHIVRPFPDMVLSLYQAYAVRHPRPPAGARRRLLLIMRNDKEGVYTPADIAALQARFPDRETVVWDTDVDEVFERERAAALIDKYLGFIGGFDHVVTDRYHGLIFAVLLQRPCVVLPTVNHKITSAAGWFAPLATVAFAGSTAEVPALLDRVVDAPAGRGVDWNAEHFDPMAELVRASFCRVT
jgi:pyruvyl transferase EpsI